MRSEPGRKGEGSVKRDSGVQKPAKFATWIYYINEERAARWKCSECGKIRTYNPYEENYCSNCGAKMKMQS